ncbi:flagellar hook-basal body protein [Bacillus spongiae]|uniref:Flagellar hook-basal body protein n=1 Tax=Bacillus spongiae TaxID=2683610 RepID=A0ABU8HIY5_9BACI
MFRGFYTVASGMIAQQRKTEILSNNLSNANTPGFKADQTSMRAFPEMLLQRIDNQQLPIKTEGMVTSSKPLNVGLNTGVYLQEAAPSFLQGDLQQTDQNTDFAVVDHEGNGTSFFTVQHPEGEFRYTRNGNFTLDHQGNLVTSSGLYVMDTNGDKITLNNNDFDVLSDGTILQNNVEVASLRISYTENPLLLKKEGDGLYSTLENELPFTKDGYTISQGYIEGANVDEGRTMTDMLTAYRSFEANQKVLQAYDTSMDKAVNEIGRVN